MFTCVSIAVIAVQASEFKVSSPGSLTSKESYFGDFLSPVPTIFQDSVRANPSYNTATIDRSPSSSLSQSPASTLSDLSPFADVLQQFAATPSCGTAAALVSPASSTCQLVAAPGSDTDALSLCNTPSGQQLAATSASSIPVPALSCQADASAGGQLSSAHMPRFSGSPVAGLCRDGSGVSQMRACLTKQQQVRHNHGTTTKADVALVSGAVCVCGLHACCAAGTALCTSSKHLLMHGSSLTVLPVTSFCQSSVVLHADAKFMHHLAAVQ